MLERYDLIDGRDLADAMRKRAEYEEGRKR